MKTISFNTGRGYTEKGQRIAAGQLDCGRVLFIDIDRGLDYVTAAPCELSQRAVMRAYDDNCQYSSTTSAYSIIPDYEIRKKMISELKALAAKL
jgi:hypothetical protein